MNWNQWKWRMRGKARRMCQRIERGPTDTLEVCAVALTLAFACKACEVSVDRYWEQQAFEQASHRQAVHRYHTMSNLVDEFLDSCSSRQVEDGTFNMDECELLLNKAQKLAFGRA